MKLLQIVKAADKAQQTGKTKVSLIYKRNFMMIGKEKKQLVGPRPFDIADFIQYFLDCPTERLRLSKLIFE